jgi:predicted nuclease of predicted toxin-antitoxin system
VKLLFDQNISFRIISKVETNFPEAKQVRQLEIENYSELEIWKFAKDNGFTIVTFDADL